MISECFNPSCRRELTYLRDGRVVRMIREDPAGGHRVEHFWLCGRCHLELDFCFAGDKVLSLKPQPCTTRLEMKPELRWTQEQMAS
jgi:hypothetical protein